jgi:hypothetical protein
LVLGLLFIFSFFACSTEVETVIHADNDFATVAFLRIKNAYLDPKDVQYFEDVQVPLLLDDGLLSVRDAVLRSQESTTSTVVLADPVPNFEFGMPNSRSQRLDSWVAVANVHRELKESVSNVTIEDEVKECFQKLQGTCFLEFGFTTQHCWLMLTTIRTSNGTQHHSIPMCEHQHIYFVHGLVHSCKCRVWHFLRHQPTSACMCRRGSATGHPRQT